MYIVCRRKEWHAIVFYIYLVLNLMFFCFNDKYSGSLPFKIKLKTLSKSKNLKYELC